MIRRIPLFLVAASLFIAVFLISAMYFRDMHRAHERVSARGRVIQSPYGDIEYIESTDSKEGGAGPPVLVIHGSGGGYDQGELIAKAVLGRGFRWIAPSRFGYLRSGIRAGATWDDQADAYADLLDQLGIERVAVVAVSQGGPSALLFAVLHPERISSLTLISCGLASASIGDQAQAQAQAQANAKGDRLAAIFEHDLVYWVGSKFFKKQLMALMGADDEVVARLTPEERDLFDDFIDFMNPVSLRTRGAAFDNTATMPGERIAAVAAPTLIFHAVDDTLQLYRNAAFADATIPHSRLMRFETGGHFLIGTEQAALRAAIESFILEPGPGPNAP